jgi:hypothetical protein
VGYSWRRPSGRQRSRDTSCSNPPTSRAAPTGPTTLKPDQDHDLSRTRDPGRSGRHRRNMRNPASSTGRCVAPRRNDTWSGWLASTDLLAFSVLKVRVRPWPRGILIPPPRPRTKRAACDRGRRGLPSDDADNVTRLATSLRRHWPPATCSEQSREASANEPTQDLDDRSPHSPTEGKWSCQRLTRVEITGEADPRLEERDRRTPAISGKRLATPLSGHLDRRRDEQQSHWASSLGRRCWHPQV